MDKHLINPFKKGDKVKLGGYVSCRCFYGGGVVIEIVKVCGPLVYFKEESTDHGLSNAHSIQCRALEGENK